jgi:glycosyltransferase involved in cell wall biosynthesis
MARRTLLVVSARLDRAAREAVAAGRWPRKDFFELARALDADVLDLDALDSSRVGRLLAKLARPALAQAVLAFTRRKRYDAIFTDGEHIGLPLAALLARTRRRPRHVTIGHLLSTRGKQRFARLLRPARGVDTVLLHATTQCEAAAALGLRSEQLRLIPYGVDERFWAAAIGERHMSPGGVADGTVACLSSPATDGETCPRPVSGAGDEGDAIICSAGLEYRDYGTLAEAVNGLPVRAVLAAGSRWSRHAAPGAAPLPPNVEVTTLDYAALRDLYSAVRFVAVPLHDVENQAGVTTLLEAMAMGKAVIVTASRGQRDLVRGRLWTAAGPSPAVLGDPRVYGVPEADAEVETGIYVPPADPAALRSAIQYLLDHPEEAARFGAAGQALVRRWCSLDRYVTEIVAAVRNERAPSSASSPTRRPSSPAGKGNAIRLPRSSEARS